MANIKHVNSIVDREFRNRVNQLIDFVNAQGKTIQDLVAEGQLTPEQYAELITVINGLIKSGHVDKSDLTPEFKDEIEVFSSQLAQKPSYNEVRLKNENLELEDMSPTVLSAIEGGEGTSFNLLSIPQDYSVSPNKTTFLDFNEEEINFFDSGNVIGGGYHRAHDGALTAATTWVSTDFIPVVANDQIKVATSVGGTYNVTYWNVNNGFVSGESYVFSTTERETHVFTAPANAAYFKVGVRTTEYETFFIGINEQKEFTNVSLKESVNVGKALNTVDLAELLPIDSITPDKTNYLEITNTRRINYFDKKSVISGGYYTSTGSYASSSTVSSSDFIPVKSNDIIRVKVLTQGNNHITYWDANGNFISGEVKVLYANQVSVFYVPSNINIAKAKIAVRNTEINTYMLTVNEEYPDSYFSYTDLDYDIGLKTKMIKAVDERVKKVDSSKLEGLKWGVIGDSISTIGYKGDGQEYPKQIAERNNMILQNLAVPGSMITKTDNPAHLTDHMCERVLELDDDCDIVTVAGGVNDYRNGVPLGAMGDTDMTTLYGAMDTLCTNLITKFPNKPKAIFTPIKYRGKETLLGNRVRIIKEVANRYGIPVYDNFVNCDLQPDIDFINNTYFYLENGVGDGLHPNGAGHTILARGIENFLENLV